MFKTLFEEIHSAGYDLEEEYFFHANQELIAELRAARIPNARDFARAAPTASMPLEATPQHPWSSSLGHFFSELVKPLPSGVGQFPV